MKWLNWLEIFLWYSCNLKCSFCFQKDLRYEKPKFLWYESVIKIIDNWISNNKRSIIFSWWESTLDPNILKYIEYCKNNGFLDIRIHTNWLSFSDKTILNKFIKSGMTWVVLSIHWYWKIHDYLVWSDWAFEKVKNTLLNLSEIKKDNNEFVIDTNTVLNKYNY